VAADLVDGAVVPAPAAIEAADALRLARRRGVAVVGCGGAWVLREDLARAATLGLGALPARALARPLPEVGPREAELDVRRRLADGAPAVIVRDRRGPIGVVGRVPPPRRVSMQARFGRWLDADTRGLMATAGRLAEARGGGAFVVGGLVRDAWLGREPARRDLDLVVDGDGLAVARALADALGGTLVEHERFLTASVTLADGRRVDVATSRAERYEAPGALPHVMPAGIGQDLARRDFSANAMAVELASGGFDLLDPLGGTSDLARRRLRVLHPLSFVEDPTRIFRGARYAARLGLRPDAWTVRCRALALELAPYPALSGQRVATEVERILGDAEPAIALTSLARAGAFRLLHRRWHPGRAALARLTALPATLGWARPLRAAPLEVTAVALAADQPAGVADAVLTGLGLTGAPLGRAREALERAPALLASLRAGDPASALARTLRGVSPTTLGWLHLVGDEAVRERLAWFAGEGRAVEPALGGDAVVGLGVPRGPEVAAVLGALRDARLDGQLRERAEEEAYVRAWIQHRTRGQRGGRPPADPEEG
jgi:tRNA nucleotidyltransferase (CCA-adding enzyme)